MQRAKGFTLRSMPTPPTRPTILAAALLAGIAVGGCKARQDAARLAASDGPSQGNLAAVRSYQDAIREFFAEGGQRDAWHWYMDRPHGFAGHSTVLVSLLPVLAPEIWGQPQDKFKRFGHFVLPGDEAHTLPSSLGRGAFPAADQPDGDLLVTTETCGTCHMGRVRVPGAGGDDVVFLYGGANHQFDIRRWRTALERTVATHLADDAGIARTADFIRAQLISQPAGFFHETPRLDQQQRQLMAAPGRAEAALRRFIATTAEFAEGKRKQRQVSYQHIDTGGSPANDEGHPGQVDASGDLLAQRLPGLEGMPPFASLTDIPSVWRQSERRGGQWDGSVGDPFLRNLAAQIAVVPGSTVDRRVAAFAATFTRSLPPPPFPFQTTADPALVDEGRALFDANCADCHGPNGADFYRQLGTDPNRSRVMSFGGSARVGQIFGEACTATLPGGVAAPACDPQMRRFLRDTRQPEGQGYAATTLTGIWARAPYLHNGSVPTLRHLLVPGTRPQRFVVGSLGYDADNVGFHWRIDRFDEYRRVDANVAVFDTTMDGLSSRGHDQPELTVGERRYRLDWTPTSTAPAHTRPLEALLAYLKTL